MPRRLQAGLTYANVVSTLCLFIVLGGGAYAASSYVSSNGELHGCVARGGSMRLVKPGKTCAKHESPVSWSQQGPEGKTGPQGTIGPRGEPGPAGAGGGSTTDAQTLQGHPASDFLGAQKLLTSGRVTKSNPNNETTVEVPLISNGTFSLAGACDRNNVGEVQSEVLVRTTEAGSYLDSFGNGTDGALARSFQFATTAAIGVLTVVPHGRDDSRSFVAVAPNGSTLTGTVSSGAAIQGADCVFTAVGAQ